MKDLIAVVYGFLSTLLFLYFSNIDSRFIKGLSRINTYAILIYFSILLIYKSNLKASVKHWLLFFVGWLTALCCLIFAVSLADMRKDFDSQCVYEATNGFVLVSAFCFIGNCYYCSKAFKKV